MISEPRERIYRSGADLGRKPATGCGLKRGLSLERLGKFRVSAARC